MLPGRWNTTRISALIATSMLLLSSCALIPTSEAPAAGEPDNASAGPSEKDDSWESGDARRTTDTAVGSAAPASGDRAVEGVPIAIVLDASGSMQAPDVASAPSVEAATTRFSSAQSAVRDLIDVLPGDQQAALLTYGTGTGNSAEERAAGCEDVTVLHAQGDVDREAMSAAVDSITPSGYTPIARALRTAYAELPDSGPRAIVLLSDGIDTCIGIGGEDPAAVAEELFIESDGEVKIHTVGFQVDGAASMQLREVADATNGTSWDALNDQQLATRLSAAIDPTLLDTALTPDGIAGLRLGMSAEQAGAVAGFDDEVPVSGRAEIVWKQCTLVFEDGVLTEISTDTLPTLDGVSAGHPVSAAEALWGRRDMRSSIEADGSVVYPADLFRGTAYRVYVEGATGPDMFENPDAVITRIALCHCAATATYRVEPPRVEEIPGCSAADCVIEDAVVPRALGGAVTIAFVVRDDDSRGAGSIVAIKPGGSVNVLADDFRFEHYSGDFDVENGQVFLTPDTDRSGAVFLSLYTYPAPQIVRVDPSSDGQFTVIRGDSMLSQVSGVTTTRFSSTSWGPLDENGYYTVEFTADATNLESESVLLEPPPSFGPDAL